MENLQKKTLKPSWVRRPGNQHQFLENATIALNAVEGDGIKLVNIGECFEFKKIIIVFDFFAVMSSLKNIKIQWL